MKLGMRSIVIAITLFASAGVLAGHVHAQQRTLGPVLRIYTDPFDFDTVYCGVRRCLPLTFHNIGDTTLTVYNHDRVRRPFYLRVDTPLVLQPGEMRTVDICYNAFQYSKDSQRVYFRADTRLPLSIAMVHDVSSSMYLMLPDGKRRYEAAHDASSEFIGNLLDTLGIVDEGAIFTFDDDAHFAMTQTWTTDTAALRAAIPGRPMGTATCIFNAISRVIDSMMTRVKMKVLIVVTDGEDSGNPPCGPVSVEQVIKKSKEENVRIYAITIGNIDRAPLIQIVEASGGKEFNATSSSDLLAIYRQIAVDMSKNVQQSVFTRGESAGPRIEFIPSTWQFDSVQVGETACQEVLVRNGGNAWLLADSVRKVFVAPYSITDFDLDSIAPYQTVPAKICFTPLVPKHYDQPMPYFPSPCEIYGDSLTATGNSFLLPRDARKTPLLEVENNVELDTTFCQTTECVTFDLRNTGDTTLTVRSMDPVTPPFSGGVAAPFSIAPGESQPVVICYRPPDAPRTDTLMLGFTADARVPQRMALLFDRSRAMDAEFMPGINRMIAAVAGASDFIDGLMFIEGFRDEVGIASFDTAGVFDWSGRFLHDRDTLRAALPEETATRPACVYDAVSSMLDGFEGTDDTPRSIMLFTTGEDAGSGACGSATVPALIARAAALYTKVHCVQLGDADSTALLQLAQGTGGRYMRPADLLDLILQLRDVELSLSSGVRFERSVVGRGVTPILAAAEDTLDFGSTVYAEGAFSARQRTYHLENIGDAPMHLQISGAGSPFIVAGQSSGNSVDTVLNPGVGIELECTFQPSAEGLFSDTLTLSHDGCTQLPVDVILRGRAVVGFTDPWRFAAAAQQPAPLRFDTMSCGAQQCLDVVFASSEFLPTTVRFPHGLQPPFIADLPDSIAIPPDGMRSLEICYRPSGTGEHDGWLVYETDDRPAYSTLFLVASDKSAGDTLGEGLSFADVATAARGMYAHWLQPVAKAGDEAALMSFDANGNETVVGYTDALYDAAAPLPVHNAAAPGSLTAALSTAMDYAASNAQGKKLIIAMVNDAMPIDAADAEALRSRAEQEDVLLAVAAVGPAGYAALGTGASVAATFDSCYTLASLQRFVYGRTRDAMEVKRDSVHLTGFSAAARLASSPLELDFGTLRVGQQHCLPLRLNNAGNAPLELLDVMNPAGPTPPGLPVTLEPGQGVTLQICFTPGQLRAQEADILVVYDGCTLDTVVVRASVYGTDSLGAGIDAVLRGMPGSVVRVPVTLYGPLPASYGVRDFELTLSYDKTMLYPLDEEIVDAGTLSANLQNPHVELQRDFDASSPMASATYSVSGATAIDLQVGEGLLLRPPFLVLHGDALETPLLLTHVQFSDGLPAAGIVAAGTFIADSLGFHEQRLVDGSDLYNAKVIGTYPNPFNPAVTIAYELREAADVRLRVHDALGREIAVLEQGRRAAGLHRVRFDASGRPSGVYFYRLESGGVTLTGSMLHLK